MSKIQEMIFLRPISDLRKPERSAHNKKIRFLIGLTMAVGVLLLTVVFLYFNHSSPVASTH